MSISDDIRELLKREGCDIVGFADLRCLSNDARQNFDYGILIALSFTKKAIQENKNGSPQRYSNEHEPMTQRLDELAFLIAKHLTDKGYKAWPKIPTMIAYKDYYTTALPHKTVATLAGIGWIGKNAMLVTKEVGSALRMTVVLTNAPLDCGAPMTKSKCNPNCTVCADTCPGNAPLGGLWEAGIDRETFFDARACRAAARARAKELLSLNETRCGLCVSNCPFTKRGLGYK